MMKKVVKSLESAVFGVGWDRPKLGCFKVVCFDLVLTGLRGCVRDKQLRSLSSFERAWPAFFSSARRYNFFMIVHRPGKCYKGSTQRFALSKKNDGYKESS